MFIQRAVAKAAALSTVAGRHLREANGADPARRDNAVVLTPSGPGEFMLFDRDLKNVVNEERFPGGMMTLLSVGQ